jgi:hypothetical protein
MGVEVKLVYGWIIDTHDVMKHCTESEYIRERIDCGYAVLDYASPFHCAPNDDLLWFVTIKVAESECELSTQYTLNQLNQITEATITKAREFAQHFTSVAISATPTIFALPHML